MIMNALNKVKIENTFRISAATPYDAAVVASTFSHRDSVVVDHIRADDMVFLVTSTIGSSVYYDVVFVELVSSGKYRAETGKAELTEIEALYITGGDYAVNETKFYKAKEEHEASKINEVMSEAEYDEWLAHWINKDKEGSVSGMESYFKNKYHRVVMVNGIFQEA